MTNQAYLCQYILKRNHLYVIQGWWDVSEIRHFTNVCGAGWAVLRWYSWAPFITLQSNSWKTNQETDEVLSRFFFFLALLCSNIEVFLPLCLCVELTDSWWDVGNECFSVKPEKCVRQGFVCSSCRCLPEGTCGATPSHGLSGFLVGINAEVSGSNPACVLSDQSLCIRTA